MKYTKTFVEHLGSNTLGIIDLIIRSTKQLTPDVLPSHMVRIINDELRYRVSKGDETTIAIIKFKLDRDDYAFDWNVFIEERMEVV